MRYFLVGVGTYLLLFWHTIQSDHYVVVLTLIFYTYRLLHVYVFIICIIVHCKKPFVHCFRFTGDICLLVFQGHFVYHRHTC